MSSKMTISAIQKLFQFSKLPGHDKVLKNVVFTGFANNRLQVEFPVTKDTLNPRGGLHGGFTACVVDVINCFSMSANGVVGAPGVTVDLHISYMKGAKEGDIVTVESRPVRVGRSIVYLECELRHKSDGSIIARGVQTNFVGSSLQEPSKPEQTN